MMVVVVAVDEDVAVAPAATAVVVVVVVELVVRLGVIDMLGRIVAYIAAEVADESLLLLLLLLLLPPADTRFGRLLVPAVALARILGVEQVEFGSVFLMLYEVVARSVMSVRFMLNCCMTASGIKMIELIGTQTLSLSDTSRYTQAVKDLASIEAIRAKR
jgi:hypothetical protein